MVHFVFLFGLLLALPGLAREESCAAILESHFSAPTFEVKYGCCHSNIYNLLKSVSVSFADAELRRVEVLFLYARNDKRENTWEYDRIEPLHTKFRKSVSWSYHTVLLRNGFIYDFDWYDAHSTPKPVPIQTYFRKMFGSYWDDSPSPEWHQAPVAWFTLGPIDLEAIERANDHRSWAEFKKLRVRNLYVRSIEAARFLSMDKNNGANPTGVFGPPHWLQYADTWIPDQLVKDFLRPYLPIRARVEMQSF